MSHARQTHARGFTLVELLVVIAIIGALAALLLVAGSAAWRAAQRGAIRAEVNQLNDAFTEYGNRYSGGAYAPNVIVPASAAVDVKADVMNDFVRHFKKAFPRSKEPAELLQRIAGQDVSGSALAAGDGLDDGISPYEALYFWLGGFSEDPQYPISGPGGPSFKVESTPYNPLNGEEDLAARKPIFDFDVTRLGPRGTDGSFDISTNRFIEYQVSVNGSAPQTRRIHFWQYVPRGRTLPYAYFDASRPINDLLHGQTGSLVAIKARAAAAPANSPLNARTVRYANEGQCQILCCGLDDSWGDFTAFQVNTNMLLYPDGPFIGEVADTITNFTVNATLADDQP